MAQNFQIAAVEELAEEQLEFDHQNFQSSAAAAEGMGPDENALGSALQSFQSSAAVEMGLALLCLETDLQSFRNAAVDLYDSDLQSFRIAVAVAELQLVH